MLHKVIEATRRYYQQGVDSDMNPKTGQLWMWHIDMEHSWNSAILAGKPWEKTAVPLGPFGNAVGWQ